MVFSPVSRKTAKNAKKHEKQGFTGLFSLFEFIKRVIKGDFQKSSKNDPFLGPFFDPFARSIEGPLGALFEPS